MTLSAPYAFCTVEAETPYCADSSAMEGSSWPSTNSPRTMRSTRLRAICPCTNSNPAFAFHAYPNDPMSTAGAYAFSSASKYAPTRCATPRYMQPNRYCTSSASRKSREENIHVIKPPSTSTAREAKGLSKPGTTGTRPMRSKLAKHDVNNGLPAFATRPCKTIDACDMRHPSDTPERSTRFAS